MGKLIPKENKIIMIPLTIISVLLTFILAYRIYTKMFHSSYEKDIKMAINNITDINKSALLLNNGQTININKSRIELPSKISSLVKIQNSIKDLNHSEKHKKLHKNLLEGLNNNILIYEQILLILNNPEGIDLENSLDNIKTYKKMCMSCYSSASDKKISISLPVETIKFIDNTSSLTYQLINIEKEKNIYESQNEYFISKLEQISMKFTDIKTNFYPQIKKTKRNTLDFDKLINLANKNKEDFKKIKIDFANLTIPEKSNTVYNSFKVVVDEYDSYIQDCFYILDSKENSTVSDDLYIKLNKKFNNIEKSYNKFENLFEEYVDLNQNSKIYY